MTQPSKVPLKQLTVRKGLHSLCLGSVLAFSPLVPQWCVLDRIRLCGLRLLFPESQLTDRSLHCLVLLSVLAPVPVAKHSRVPVSPLAARSGLHLSFGVSVLAFLSSLPQWSALDRTQHPPFETHSLGKRYCAALFWFLCQCQFELCLGDTVARPVFNGPHSNPLSFRSWFFIGQPRNVESMVHSTVCAGKRVELEESSMCLLQLAGPTLCDDCEDYHCEMLSCSQCRYFTCFNAGRGAPACTAHSKDNSTGDTPIHPTPSPIPLGALVGGMGGGGRGEWAPNSSVRLVLSCSY